VKPCSEPYRDEQHRQEEREMLQRRLLIVAIMDCGSRTLQAANSTSRSCVRAPWSAGDRRQRLTSPQATLQQTQSFRRAFAESAQFAIVSTSDEILRRDTGFMRPLGLLVEVALKPGWAHHISSEPIAG
jgi:hypothetical protein